jgi:hypothetical protein
MSSISEALSGLPPQFYVTATTIVQTSLAQIVTLCGANPLRWALIIGPPYSDGSAAIEGGTIALANFPAGAKAGYVVGPNGNLELNFRDDGILAQQSFTGNAIGGSANWHWYVIEVIVQQ